MDGLNPGFEERSEIFQEVVVALKEKVVELQGAHAAPLYNERIGENGRIEFFPYASSAGALENVSAYLVRHFGADKKHKLTEDQADDIALKARNAVVVDMNLSMLEGRKCVFTNNSTRGYRETFVSTVYASAINEIASQFLSDKNAKQSEEEKPKLFVDGEPSFRYLLSLTEKFAKQSRILSLNVVDVARAVHSELTL